MVAWRLYEDDLSFPFTYVRVSTALDSPPLLTGTVSAREYVEFARDELTVGSPRALINSFSHSKRALHHLVDSLLNAYGMLQRNKDLPFPRKLELMDDVGLLSLRILRTLNVERNAMEHDYEVPKEDRVAEAVDVAHLLVLSSTQLIKRIPYECFVGLREGGHGLLVLDPLTGTLRLHRIRDTKGLLHYVDGVECFSGHFRGGIPERTISLSDVELDPLEMFKLTYGTRQSWVQLLGAIVIEQRDLDIKVRVRELDDDRVEVITLARLHIPKDVQNYLEEEWGKYGTLVEGPYDPTRFSLIDWAASPDDPYGTEVL